MNPSLDLPAAAATSLPRPRVSYSVVRMAGQLLLLADLVCLLGAASFSTLLYQRWSTSLLLVPGDYGDASRVALVALVLAPFILYDRHFGAVASRGQAAALVHSYGLRFTTLVGVIVALGAAGHALGDGPRLWLLLWIVIALLLTSLTRTLVALQVRRLQRRGALAEVIAIVGAGPVADRLAGVLRRTRPDSIALLGVFDERRRRPEHGAGTAVGTVADLIELGKTRRIDCIVLTLPPTATQRLNETVQRLKALSSPIGLCPQDIGLGTPHSAIHYVGDRVPVNVLAHRPVGQWSASSSADEGPLPRWLITLAALPLMLFEALAPRLAARAVRTTPGTPPDLTLSFDDYELGSFAQVAAGFGQDQYGYVVTPNADHIIRLHEDTSFRALYQSASYILFDSRFLAGMLRAVAGVRLPVCTGSDLTQKLLGEVVAPDDALVLIGGSAEQAQRLRERYGLRQLSHFNPPMGFIHDRAETENCLRFVEAHSPFRFCLLAVGSPQQEMIAKQLQSRAAARGLALCIGASINFLTGDERRAPRWMQRCGIEWAHRLMLSPRRMAHRYLVRGPRVFGLLGRATIVLRPALLADRLLPARSVVPRPQAWIGRRMRPRQGLLSAAALAGAQRGKSAARAVGSPSTIGERS